MSAVYEALTRAMGDVPVTLGLGEAASNSLAASLNGMKAIFGEEQYRAWLRLCQDIGVLV